MKSISKLIETNPMASKEMAVIATNIVNECVKFGAKYGVNPSDAYKRVAEVVNRGAEDKVFMGVVDFGAILYNVHGEQVWDESAKASINDFLGKSN